MGNVLMLAAVWSLICWPLGSEWRKARRDARSIADHRRAMRALQ
jgi:hypothetical protein